jgi:hypothetical protein
MKRLPLSVVRLAPKLLLFLILMGQSGCASGPRMFVNSEADMTFYEQVAVLPFHNLSTGRFAGQRVTRAFIIELIITERYDVIEPGEFRTALARIGGEPNGKGEYDPAKLRQAAQQVQATGVIRGAVTEFQMQRYGSDHFPVVSFDIEMLDVETGKIVWRISTTRKGKGRFPVLGGESSRTLGKLTQDACEEVVTSLEREAF